MSRDVKSSYYDQGKIEVFDVIKAKLTSEQFIGFLLGNAIKYSLRANWKGKQERDLEKLVNYSTWLLSYLKEELNSQLVIPDSGTLSYKEKDKKEFQENIPILFDDIGV